MDVRKSLLVKSLRELLTTTACLTHSNKQATYIQDDEIKVNINLTYVEGISEELRCIFRSHKIRYHFLYSEHLA